MWQRPIAGSLHVFASEALEMVQDEFVVTIERLPTSPIARGAPWAVESTMSVKGTVAKTRSRTGPTGSR
jgi:hypothetical protein